MTRSLSIIVLILAACATGLSHQQFQASVLWTLENKCSKSPGPIAEADVFGCDEVWSDGQHISMLTYRNVDVGVSFIDNGSYVIADLLVRNRSTDRVLFDPRTAMTMLYTTKTESDNHQKPLTASIAIPAERVAGKIESRVRWQNAFSAIGAALSTRRATVEVGNGQTLTVSVPDTVAQQRAFRLNAERAAAATIAVDDILSTALRANTVLPENSIRGLLYFRRDKKAHFGITGLKVGDVLFLFEVPLWN